MLPTVLGASSSNISKTMSPWLVVMVIVDMAGLPPFSRSQFEAQRVAAHVGAVDGAGDALGLLRSAPRRAAKRSSRRTLRIASPSRPVAAHGGDQVGDSASPAARPPEAISLRVRRR